MNHFIIATDSFPPNFSVFFVKLLYHSEISLSDLSSWNKGSPIFYQPRLLQKPFLDMSVQPEN